MLRIANDKVISQEFESGPNMCVYAKRIHSCPLIEYRVSFWNTGSVPLYICISSAWIQRKEAMCMCVTEYCHLYLAFSRKDWILNYSMWERSVNCVIFLYQHKVSMKKCSGCESAADLVHISSSAIKATRLQCFTLHPIVQSKRCGIKGPPRPLAPGHLRLWESTAVSAATPTCII